MFPVSLLPPTISEIFAQTSMTGTMTLANRSSLMIALLDESISEEERTSIDRLFYAIRQGWVQVVDELAVI